MTRGPGLVVFGVAHGWASPRFRRVTSEPTRDLAAWRREYEDCGLTEADLGPDPVIAFVGWLVAAGQAGLHEPNAMVVSTLSAQLSLTSRMVLLKCVDARGFVFYTNYDSAKAADLAAHPECALLFPWHPLERQVRIEGVAEKVAPAESDAYFAARPRNAQIGAWASPQSTTVPDREFLQNRFTAESDRFSDVERIPRPDHWGGFRIRPHLIEFWQGRPGRLHDRIRFRHVDETTWATERLAP